jgi:hypothetical protein
MKTGIIYSIYGAYEWRDMENANKDTTTAIRALIDQVERRIKSNLKVDHAKIRYNRLRATAGSFLLDGIAKRIANSDAIIFDITSYNPNVMLELGIALHSARELNGANVFIICKGESLQVAKIPSDLQGYFVSLYEIKNGAAVFHDNNSLAMRIVSDVSQKYNIAYKEYNEDN